MHETEISVIKPAHPIKILGVWALIKAVDIVPQWNNYKTFLHVFLLEIQGSAFIFHCIDFQYIL